MKSGPFYLLISFIIFTASVKAQQRVSDTVVSTLLIQASYSLQFPGKDITDQYGYNSTIGAVLGYKTSKNWLWNAHLGFIFGDQVKGRENLLSMISTPTGEIIDGDGTYTSLALFERGYHLQAKIGKIIPVFGPNPNSGIYIMTGLGYLAHRIHIETQFGTAPQIAGDYAKGYDKLRGGFAHSIESGYMLMSNHRALNFSLGFEFIHAYTRSLRDYDFNLMDFDATKYTDHYYGLRINWLIPAYKRAPQRYYYY
jgi:hypothetical protein